MADITSQDVIRVVVSILVSAVMIGVLVPVLNGMTETGKPLAQYADLVNIIPMILVVVLIIVAISPIIKKNF